MQRYYGTMTTDTALPGQGEGPYLFFCCGSTGINGELWSATAQRAEATLPKMEPELASAILRYAGNMIGGDVSTEMKALLSRQPYLDSTASGQLYFPGRLTERDGRQLFVDASGVEMEVLGWSDWHQHHGEVTGVPLLKSRDFWCGGSANAPAYYGTENLDCDNTSVRPFRVPAVPMAPAPTAPSRHRPRTR